MKLHKILPALAIASVAMTSCIEDPDMPPMVVPQSPYYDRANTTLLDLKTAYWSTDRNYVKTVGLTDEGKHIIVRGRVISSDESGNIYKSVVIYDGTAALALSINSSDLYKTHHFGQEVAYDLTGLKIGGYNGLMQIGGEGVYNGAPSMTFADSDEMTEHGGAHGFADPAAVDTATVTMADLAAFKGTSEGLIEWQSRLVRVNNVTFEDAGALFAPDGNTNRYVTDTDGNRLLVRCSNYSSFAVDTIPAGSGSLVGILSYFGTDWQLMMIDSQSAIGFDGTVAPIVSPISPDSVNTTIRDIKTMYWSTDRNYVNQVGTTATNGHYYVRGRIISSDATGNVYKNMVLYDGTAAIAIALNNNKLYTTYPFGQELIVDLTDLYIGGYNGLMQIGGATEYNGAPSMGFGEPSTFAKHAGREGRPDPAAVDTATVTISDVITYKATTEGLIEWQSRLVRFDGVSFEDAGQQYAPSSSTNHYITDASGNRLLVRCSNYATWAKETIPSGTGSLVGILSYYGTDWQLLMIDAQSAIGFDGTSTPDVPVTPGEALTELEMDFRGITSIDQLPGWSLASVTGSRKWLFKSFTDKTTGETSYYASNTNYTKDSQSPACDSWLITPALNVDGMTSKHFTFDSQVAYTGDDTCEVYVMTSADPATAKLTKLPAVFPQSQAESGAATGPYSPWTSCGDFDLSAYSGTIYIGFRYVAPAGTSFHTYCVSNIVVGK